jgi:hypothetical protein
MWMDDCRARLAQFAQAVTDALATEEIGVSHGLLLVKLERGKRTTCGSTPGLLLRDMTARCKIQ